jgi:hypothetical protein
MSLMERRDFIAAAAGSSLAAATARAATPPQLLELRKVRLRFGPMEARYADYARDALVPALNRAGVKPVGAFTVLVGPDAPAVYLLLPHPSAESLVGLSARLADDAEYRRAAAAFRALPAGDPPYVRRESSLMLAFASMPAVEAPAGPQAASSRVFELRTYESHNESATSKKIEMFESGGEIAIFRRVGLAPVFFARDLVGATLPSLTYMVVFSDMAAREKAWAAFREDADWVKLRSTPGLSNADIVSNIRSVLLRPAPYSQI